MNKYINIFAALVFCILLQVSFPGYAAWDIKEKLPIEKLDNRESRQYGATHVDYKPAFIAGCEDSYYKRPEIPFVLELLQIKEGMTIGDIGCGVGSFTFAIANQTGKTGKVYAIDMQEKMISVVQKHLQEKKQNHYDNIIAYVNKCNTTYIPRHELDIAWLGMVHFHNFPVLYQENVDMIKSIYDAVKPGGKLVISDEADVDGYVTDPAVNIIKHYRQAGFILVRGPLKDPNTKGSFYLVFSKSKDDN